MKKIKYLFVIILLKLKYGSRFETKTIRLAIDSLNSINITKGKIICDGYIKISKKSSISVRENGVIKFGKNFYSNDNLICTAHKSIKFGDDVSIGPNCCFFDHNHYFDESGQVHGEYKTDSIVVGNNVWIGANCVILKGTKIGDNCIIGAGTIVKGEIPSNSLVTNNRDIIIKKLEKR